MAKLSDITNAENPVTGKKFNVFNIGELWSMILGAGVLFLVVSMGQKVANTISGKVPYVSTTIQDPVQHPAPVSNQMRVI